MTPCPPGSPNTGGNAIGLAAACGLATDQRGATRPGGACDSGAYEFIACPDLVLDLAVFGTETREQSLAPLVVGGKYIFRLHYGTRFLNLPGRVVWCHEHRLEITERGARAIYQTGVELSPGRPVPRWRAALADQTGVAVGV